jgi:ribonucleoside-diphosphate reductase alpha chain
VTVKPDEWVKVGEWMWNNRRYYNGLSILPFSDHSYKQAPFEDCDAETYEKMLNSLVNVDLTSVVESEDNTDLKGELACAGGACEII